MSQTRVLYKKDDINIKEENSIRLKIKNNWSYLDENKGPDSNLNSVIVLVNLPWLNL